MYRRSPGRSTLVVVFLFFLLAGSVSACSVGQTASPTEPGTIQTPLVVPDALAPSVALIDADTRVVPFLDEAAGTWFRRHVRGIRLDPSLPTNVRAQCCGPDRLIRWSTSWLPDPGDSRDAQVAAAILIHEARHAQGYLHSCADQRRDRTFGEGGAWALQSAWLRHRGDVATADLIVNFDIGCK